MAGSDLASWCCVISWCRVVLAVYIRRPREARRKDECAVVEDRRVREKENTTTENASAAGVISLPRRAKPSATMQRSR